MTVTQSFRRNWTTHSGDSDSKYFERRCGRPPRTPIVNVWWEPFAGSVWISSSHSARSICASSSRLPGVVVQRLVVQSAVHQSILVVAVVNTHPHPLTDYGGFVLELDLHVIAALV